MNDNLGTAVILTDKKQKLLIRFIGLSSSKLINLNQVCDYKEYFSPISVFQKMIYNFVNHFGT